MVRAGREGHWTIKTCLKSGLHVTGRVLQVFIAALHLVSNPNRRKLDDLSMRSRNSGAK
jgi:hypothetical protein